MNTKRIAIIPPFEARDILGDTVVDGFLDLQKDGVVELAFPKWYTYPTTLDLTPFLLSEQEFVSYAQKADLIILIHGKRGTNYALAEKIGAWSKTVFVDGSEVGKNRRYDPEVHMRVLRNDFDSERSINTTMLSKCKAYFRREKPYIETIIPLPFGIERRYIHYKPGVKKDIDIFCIFGQTEYPPMRKFAVELVKDFCAKNNLTCETTPTQGFAFDDTKSQGRNLFYEKLARSKVGISIGGGGFDTGRFWEILGNNCILLTEKIDILHPDDTSLRWPRIIEFFNLYDLQYELQKLTPSLKDGSYEKMLTDDEYRKILQIHSARARAEKILEQ